MQTRDPGTIAAGDEISATFLNALSEACGLSSGGGASAPLSMQKTAAGTQVRYSGPIFGAFLCVAATTITARSGTTLGSGTATIQALSGTTTVTAGALGSVPAIKVFNFSSGTGGIAVGKYLVAMKVGGRYLVVAAEC